MNNYTFKLLELNIRKNLCDTFVAFRRIFEFVTQRTNKRQKNRLTIDASLCLLHDIQIAKNLKNIFLCLFLDVKDAFNHVLIGRLIVILEKLKMLNQLIR